MLAPLDGVQVDTLLHQLPQGAELSQEGDALLHSLQDVVNLSLGGETADTKADTAVSALVAVSKGSEDVTGLQRGRSTGTARRQRNVLEGHQEGLALNVGKRHVDAAGVEGVGRTVLGGVLHGKKAVEQTVREVLDTLGVVLSPHR